MMNLYYKIWADAIISAKKKNSNWKILVLLLSVAQGANLITVFLWFKVITKINIPIFLEFNVFPIKILNSFLSGFTSMILPFMILNYFLIVHKKKYKKIIRIYNGKDGVLVMKYVIISFGIFIIPLIIGKLIFG